MAQNSNNNMPYNVKGVVVDGKAAVIINGSKPIKLPNSSKFSLFDWILRKGKQLEKKQIKK